MFQVDTASHGGIMVHRSVVPDLSPAAQKVGDPNPPFLCYEEDCDAAVVFRELLDIPEWKIPSGYLNTRANFESAIDRSLEAWHKDYLASRDPSHPTLQQHLKKMGLPESCYCILPSTQEVIIVQRGESGYTRAVCSSGDVSMNRKIVDRENQALGVSPAQEEAMRVGSMFGWTVPGANPQNYAEDGTLKKAKRKSQPER